MQNWIQINFILYFQNFIKFWNSGIPDSIFSLKDKAFIFPKIHMYSRAEIRSTYVPAWETLSLSKNMLNHQVYISQVHKK